MKENNTVNFNLKISSIEDNQDGTTTISFDLSEDFVEWFKESQGLKKWSQKRFDKFMNEAITSHIDKKNK